MNNSNLFYCYSLNLFHFLRDRNFYYLERGINERTNRVYWTFDRTENFNKVLTEYGMNNPNKR